MAITDKVDKLNQAIAWPGEMPLTSRYSAGIAGERFFRAIKDEGRILGTHCAACDLVYVPAAIFCERCFARLDEWVEVSSRGEVFTYTVLHRDLDDRPLDPPLVLAYVKLHGSSGGLVHFLGGVPPGEVHIGMEVEALFKDVAERKGSIRDIVHFRPVTDP